MGLNWEKENVHGMKKKLPTFSGGSVLDQRVILRKKQ